MDLMFSTIGLIIFVALVFDYINGFHDAANSIATVVSTRVLSPAQAVAWAAFFNFVAAFLFGTAVAKTVGSGMVELSVVTYSVILAGLIGAITWNLITWYFGLPTSSSHALFGGYGGAAVAKAGFSAIIYSGWTKTLIFIVVAPLVGLTVGLLTMTAIFWTCYDSPPARVDRWFRRLQLVSAAAYSLMHGANDAQKTMGIIAGALYTGGYIATFYIPFWVIIIAHAAIGLGTLSGGWRIIKTMGQKITKLTAARRLRRRDRRGDRDLHGHADGRRHQHHAHDHRCDRRRRLDAAPERGPLGRRRADRLGLDPDDSRLGDDRRDDVFSDQSLSIDLDVETVEEVEEVERPQKRFLYYPYSLHCLHV